MGGREGCTVLRLSSVDANSAQCHPHGPLPVLSTLTLVGLLALAWAFSSALVSGAGRVRLPGRHGHTLHHTRQAEHERRHAAVGGADGRRGQPAGEGEEGGGR
jgi:hypothetical protein